MTKANLSRITLLVSVLALALAAAANAQTPTPTPAPLKFFAVTPCRVVDTRGPTGTNGGPIMVGGSPRNFQINSLCGVPSTAKAATLNVTLVDALRSGRLRQDLAIQHDDAEGLYDQRCGRRASDREWGDRAAHESIPISTSRLSMERLNPGTAH